MYLIVTTMISAQTIIDMCYGFNRPQNPAACGSIVPVPGSNNLVNATIYTAGINAQNVAVEGIDYEASYRTDLSAISESLPGALTLRLLVSQRLKDETNLNGDSQPPALGTYGSLKWKAFQTTSYTLGPSRTTFTTRYYGPATISNQPTTSSTGYPANFNHVKAFWYFDLNENFDVTLGGQKVTLYAGIENLLNKAPPPIPGGRAFGSDSPYDLIGRTYRLGFRFKY